MAQQIFAYVIHTDGKADDTAVELVAAARKLDPEATVTAVVAGHGETLNRVCTELTGVFPAVWKIDDASLSYVIADTVREMLVRILPEKSAVLIANEHFAMDLAPGLSIKLGAAYLPDAVDFEGIQGNRLTAVREEYNGQVSTHVQCDIGEGAVITVRSGAFSPEEGAEAEAGGQIIDKTATALAGGVPGAARVFSEIVAVEAGDVDITKSEILVSVGRGIEDQDNLEIIHELAEAVGGEVSCSRPIVDAKWLEKSRQVGTSGQTVKPKVYMALGISGSFQHLGGIKGSPFIVAVNKNPKAPIYQVADVGVVADIIDFVPELTDKINEMR